MINWNVSKTDHDLIMKIVYRAQSKSKAVPQREQLMDLTACHANGCPLKLAELLNAPDFDFTHDVFGITRHINRQTGQLEDSFLPRYAH